MNLTMGEKIHINSPEKVTPKEENSDLKRLQSLLEKKWNGEVKESWLGPFSQVLDMREINDATFQSNPKTLEEAKKSVADYRCGWQEIDDIIRKPAESFTQNKSLTEIFDKASRA